MIDIHIIGRPAAVALTMERRFAMGTENLAFQQVWRVGVDGAVFALTGCRVQYRLHLCKQFVADDGFMGILKYNGLLARYEKATARLAEITAEKDLEHNQDRELRLFIEALKKQPLVLEEWDERLWIAILDRATVFRDGRIVFKFKSGSEIEVER